MDQKGQNRACLTILHVEEDPVLVKTVQAAFTIFGFQGDMLTAGRVQEALDMLVKRAMAHEPIDLILVDMQLPDGVGLEVIHRVKTDPAWRLTPVIVLSSEQTPGMIDAAYALGANCFVPKQGKSTGLFDSLRMLYDCWFQLADLPPYAASIDRLQDALCRATYLRARTAEFYLNLAQKFDGTPEMDFWLNRSLNEGSLSNLFAFLQSKVTETGVSPTLVKRLYGMQAHVQLGLDAAEKALRNTPAPRPAEAYAWALDIVGALNEDIVAEVMGSLFPKGPEAIRALKARAAMQCKELAHHILERSKEEKLRLRAEGLLEWAEHLATGHP